MTQEHEPVSISDVFSSYTEDQRTRLKGLAEFLSEAIPIVEDVDVINERLQESGRADLVISKIAKIMEVARPDDLIDLTNNFTPKFRMWTDSEVTADSEDEPIPVTREELKDLMHGKISSTEDLVDKTKHEYALWSINHSEEPSFQRMLVLFPEFTVPFVLEMSQPENRGGNRDVRFEPELYVAYQLMSRLIDKNDPKVLNDDGQVDSWILCH